MEVIFRFLVALSALSLLLNVYNWYFGKPAIPTNLDRLAQRIVKGKPPPHINLILKERVSGYVEHYKLVPGRVACRVEPYHDRATGEHVYALVLGFKEHVSKPADKYITIPVYKNGKLYE